MGFLFTYFGQAGTDATEDEKATGLNKFGMTYDLQSFEDFYDKNATATSADYINGVSLEGGSNFTVDGQPVKTFYSEAGANLVNKDGVISAGEKVQRSNSMNLTTYEEGFSNEKGSTGKRMHLHQPGSSWTFRDKNGFYPPFNEAPGQNGGPSNVDYNNYPSSRNNDVRNVMINKTHIYLYNADKSQTIKIAR